MDKDRKKYLLDYAKKTYKRVPLDVKLDEYDLLKQEADRKGSFSTHPMRSKLWILQN